MPDMNVNKIQSKNTAICGTHQLLATKTVE